MDRRYIFGGLAVLFIAAIVAVGFLGTNPRWNSNEREVQVVNVVDDQGNPVEGANTIVIDRDWHGPPFGILFFPLGILLVFGLARLFFGGPRRDGPWGPGGPGGAAWMDEWHRRQHQLNPSDEPRDTTGTPSPSA